MRKVFSSILPKCIAVMPLLCSSKARDKTIPTRSKRISAAIYRCIGVG